MPVITEKNKKQKRYFQIGECCVQIALSEGRSQRRKSSRIDNKEIIVRVYNSTTNQNIYSTFTWYQSLGEAL